MSIITPKKLETWIIVNVKNSNLVFLENIPKNLEIELLIWEFIYKENQGVKDSVLFFILTKYQMISTAWHDHMTVTVTYPQKRIRKSSILAMGKMFWKFDFSKSYWYTKHTSVTIMSLYHVLILWRLLANQNNVVCNSAMIFHP